MGVIPSSTRREDCAPFSLSAAFSSSAAPALAHIKLTSPGNFQVTDAFGGPNKSEPCGEAGTPTGIVTHWAGQLGDGRAIGLGELNGFELQLKGAGPTPYSRRGDGRAVLRSSIREFLCSEAMHHLGVPTTRALSLVLSGDRVVRDMFYDGHPEAEPGAIVCRVAKSFLRFGNFELCTSRDDVALLRQLGEFTLTHYFPHLDSISALLTEVAQRTASLMAQWQAVGFVHGVMNTDNMSMLGLTIDYGPYGWVDDFDPGWTPNTTDAEQRRYRFGNQPGIGLWNIERLGIALLPLMGDPLCQGSCRLG